MNKEDIKSSLCRRCKFKVLSEDVEISAVTEMRLDPTILVCSLPIFSLSNLSLVLPLYNYHNDNISFILSVSIGPQVYDVLPPFRYDALSFYMSLLVL